MPDLEAFKAQDGTVISGRRAYREYCKRHNVTNPSDFKEEWKRKGEERARMFTPGSGYDRERRIEALKRAWETESRRK